ncbi:MAG: hypothetical protein ABI678_31345, partial [Kofleriaceae bacterium]
EAGKAPPWCGNGYQPSKLDSAKGWFTSDRENNGWTPKGMDYLARAACDKTDSERQAFVAKWAADFKTSFAATDRDFVEAMTYFISPKEQRSKLEDEQCASYKQKLADQEASAETRALTSAEASVLGCAREPEGDFLAWVDRPQISERHRVALVQKCINFDVDKEDNQKGEFAFCSVDMKALDRARFDKELAAIHVNFYGKVTAVLSFGEAKAKANALLEKYAAKAKKDDAWAKLYAAPEKGYKGWLATYEANKPAFQAVRGFDDQLNVGSKKALTGCGDTLHKLWFDHMKGKKLKGLEDAKTLGTDTVGYPLLVAMMRCDAAEKRYLPVAAAQDLFMQGAKDQRGPRYAAYGATMNVLNDLVADREKFPLKALYPAPPELGRKLWYKAYEQTFNNISYDHGTGQIKAIKKSGDTVQLTFKTVRWKEEQAYDCVPTRRIYRITEDGTIEYEHKCKYKMVAMSSTLEPVTVASDFADGLKPGLMVDLLIDNKKGARVGIPKGVYKDIAKKKFIGTYGVVW